MPDFLPIFGVESPINSVKASIYATVGAPMYCYIIGNLYFFTTRLRLFCLVRHKRNHWINALYLDKKDAKRVEFDVAATITNAAMNPRSLIRNKDSRNYETLVSFDRRSIYFFFHHVVLIVSNTSLPLAKK